MRVICFGDSNTYGFDPRNMLGGRYAASERWTALLAEKTGWEVVDRGLNGREIPRGAVPGELAAECAAADVLLVMLGTNDLLQGASAAEAAARMEGFLRGVRPYCRQVLLVSPPRMVRGAWVETDAVAAESVRLAEEYRALAEKLGIPFADTRGWEIELRFDGVHFTENGHRTFAERLARHPIFAA